MSSKLLTAYRKYESEFKRLQEAVEVVRGKMLLLEEAGALEDAAREAQDLSPEELGKLFPTPVQSSPPDELNLTERIVGIVDRLPLNVKTKRAEIANQLLKDGYKNDSPNFKVTMFKTLQRLVKQGRITGIKNEGEWFYGPTNPL